MTVSRELGPLCIARQTLAGRQARPRRRKRGRSTNGQMPPTVGVINISQARLIKGGAWRPESLSIGKVPKPCG
jgi:hypothetical protein